MTDKSDRKKVLTIGTSRVLDMLASLPQPQSAPSAVASVLAKMSPKPVKDGEVPDKTIVRRGNRQMKLMKAVMSGGFVYRPTKSESGRK